MYLSSLVIKISSTINKRYLHPSYNLLVYVRGRWSVSGMFDLFRELIRISWVLENFLIFFVHLLGFIFHII
jgi:hypothetical protein